VKIKHGKTVYEWVDIPTAVARMPYSFWTDLGVYPEDLNPGVKVKVPVIASERIVHLKNLANVHDIVEYKVEITQGELREFLAAVDELARLRGEAPVEATMPEVHVTPENDLMRG
jgi:hypothetical protein